MGVGSARDVVYACVLPRGSRGGLVRLCCAEQGAGRGLLEAFLA